MKNNCVLKTNSRTTRCTSFRNHLTSLRDGNPAEIFQSLLGHTQSSANINLKAIFAEKKVKDNKNQRTSNDGKEVKATPAV